MKVVKLHGLGNDFLIIEEKEIKRDEYATLAKQLCHRQTGIGADGLIVVVPSSVADIGMRIFNADGSEAEMCGNGMRCFAKYVFDHDVVKKEHMTVETLAGIVEPSLLIVDGEVKQIAVQMGKPSFEPGDVPILLKENKVFKYPIEVDGKLYEANSILLGVPHTQIFVSDITEAPVTTLGPKIEKHPLFPKGTNVNFVEVVDDGRIKVRTWERGAGATLACGTGSCASAVVTFENGLTKREVIVELYLGELVISYEKDKTVVMTGPAEEVFSVDLK